MVPDFSSSIDGIENVFSIDANHMDMCRYLNRTFDGYRKVTGELQRLYGIIRKAKSKEKQIAKHDRLVQCQSTNISYKY